jgi:hypothetical protein
LDELTVYNIYQDTMYVYHHARQQLNNKVASLASFAAAPNQPRDDGGHYSYQMAAARVQTQVNLRYVCPSCSIPASSIHIDVHIRYARGGQPNSQARYEGYV